MIGRTQSVMHYSLYLEIIRQLKNLQISSLNKSYFFCKIKNSKDVAKFEDFSSKIFNDDALNVDKMNILENYGAKKAVRFKA